MNLKSCNTGTYISEDKKYIYDVYVDEQDETYVDVYEQDGDRYINSDEIHRLSDFSTSKAKPIAVKRDYDVLYIDNELTQLEEVLSLAEQPKKEKFLEMADMGYGVIVRNDNDDAKFSHFHWNNVHFNLFDEIPENVTELKRRIHFEKEKNILSERDLKELLKILNSKPTKKAGKGFNTIHDFTVAQWELLNDREVDEKY